MCVSIEREKSVYKERVCMWREKDRWKEGVCREVTALLHLC